MVNNTFTVKTNYPKRWSDQFMKSCTTMSEKRKYPDKRLVCIELVRLPVGQELTYKII